MLDNRFWKKYFRVYDVLNFVIPYQLLIDYIVDELSVKNGDSVLDAGCGTGNVCIKVKKMGGEVIGVDNIEEAIKAYKIKDPEAKVILHDLVHSLPFQNAFFDKIICNNVLYTIPLEKRDFVISEFYRVLKVGGIIVVSNPKHEARPQAIYFGHIKKSFVEYGLLKTINDVLAMIPLTLKMFYYNFLIHREIESGSFVFFSKASQECLLEKNNFKVIKSKSVYHGQAIFTKAEK